ncbi:sugar phosphate nucleotidyltransferase [Micromonospora sp. WMMD1155]|uniref:sugar phosphate nucleotidyltransferase n=1 Tax=Micromonospora sp. WMMD1155 TaxID=3016094 RepID=UPI002499E84B|nr:sugar phosphate nucleotidyltransferase [Micromonospora sp. WMMD1155]WFE54915.1 sugar phosphate nucleotidyltransferase [Micromonospora sp. WMMD1155]
MKAVIAVAGMGSRFFPIGKTINKSMLPILNHPVLAYAVADCIAAGAREIAIVTAPGEAGRQVRHYLSEDHDLKAYFSARGWQDKYAPLADLHHQADFTFLEQPRDDRYGTALPAIIAAEFIGNEDFLLVAGDDLLLRADGGSDLADLAAARAAAGTPAALAAATVPGAEAHRYGILHPRTAAAGHHLLDELLEKPDSYGEPTAYINISRTLLPADAVAYFQKLTPASNGEYQATDAVAAFARDHDVLIQPITGQYHDCGNPAGWLAANNAAAAIQALTVTGPRD